MNLTDTKEVENPYEDFTLNDLKVIIKSIEFKGIRKSNRYKQTKFTKRINRFSQQLV